MLNVGDIVGRYKVEGILGEGGMATVYKVRHTQLGSLHALKILLTGSPKIRQRLLAEGRTQASLKHANVVAVTDVLRIDDAPALLLEYVEGPSLHQLLAQGSMPVDEALAIFEGVVHGVAAAHRAGIVHRDLKPGNILLSIGEDGIVPKVADFGLVKAGHTRVGQAMGTPDYMAPEQVRDASSVDHRADIWSLGVILYQLVCGTLPFPGETALETMNLVVAGELVPPEHVRPNLPPGLLHVLHDILVVDPDKRLPHCAALSERLFSREATGEFGAITNPVPMLASTGAANLHQRFHGTTVPDESELLLCTPDDEWRAPETVLEFAALAAFALSATAGLAATAMLV